MKPNQSKGGSPVHQTVAEKIQFQSAGQSIQIEFTDQQHMGYWEKYGYHVDGVTAR